MRKRRSPDRWRRPMLALFAGVGMLWTAGCSLAGVQADPNEFLKQTVSGLSGTDDFRFEGTANVSVGGLPMQERAAFQGGVTGHNRLTMKFTNNPGTGTVDTMRQQSPTPVVFSRKMNEWVLQEGGPESDASLLLHWSPVYKLEQLNTMNKRVESARDEAESRLTVLTVTPDAGEVTESVKKQFTEQRGKLDTEKKLAELRSKLGLSDREAGRLRAELEQSVQRTKSLLDEADRTLQAEAVYRIWVDRVTRLPQRMEASTELRYTADGKPKEEKTRVDYRFSGYKSAGGG